MTTYISVSKFLGYTLLRPPANALSVSKYIGYTVLRPPVYALSVSKVVGYAILDAAPLWRYQQDWPNPILPRYPRHEPGGQNPNLFPPPPPPPAAVDFPNPRPIRVLTHAVGYRNTALLASLVPVIHDDGYTYVVF